MKDASSSTFTGPLPVGRPAQAAVVMEKVNQWYGRMHVLRDVSLRVDHGSCVVLCGPSGSGKSSAIRCISRLETHQTGRIAVEGVELTEDPACIERIRRDVAMIFQSVNLFPHMTVLENCTLAPIWSRGMPREEAEAAALQALRTTGLLDKAEDHPAALHAGQLQRVAIARALCMSPRIMLFDEPTAALQPAMRDEVLDVMATVAQSGMTMICVANEMDFARHVADQVIFMDHGTVVADAPADQFFAQSFHPALQVFLAELASGGKKTPQL